MSLYIFTPGSGQIPWQFPLVRVTVFLDDMPKIGGRIPLKSSPTEQIRIQERSYLIPPGSWCIEAPKKPTWLSWPERKKSLAERLLKQRLSRDLKRRFSKWLAFLQR